MYTYRPIKKGTTDVTVYVKVIDDTDGTPETSVAYDTAGVDLWYMREGADHVAITEASVTAAAAHSDGGFVHISDGICRLDLPDAACASGVNGVMVGGVFTDMIVIGCYIPLVDYDPYDTVRMGMTALPNAAQSAAGGIPVKTDIASASDVVDEWETQSQADPTGFHVNVLEVNGTAQTANDNGADINAILADTGTDGVALADGSITAAKIGADAITNAKIADDAIGAEHFAAGAIDANALAADAIDEFWDELMETGVTGRNALRALIAFVAGKVSGGGTTSITFRDYNDSLDIIAQTVDSDGDRSATTLTFS